MSGRAIARRLRFQTRIGAGAFGTVYLGELSSPQGLRQQVAIKVLSRDATTPESVARARDEARLLGLLNHDHIVKVSELFEIDGRTAFVMEYVEGISAEALLGRLGRLPPRAALAIVAAVAEALDAAWNAIEPGTARQLRVIHRDIKPANVLVSVSGGVKVLDFGIARAEFDRDAETRSDHPGTLAFMAPECFMGAPPSPTMDVYALGLTLARLLGRRDLSRLVSQETRFLSQREQLLGELHDALPRGPWLEDLIALLRRMLAWRPEDRPVGPELQDLLLGLEERAPGERLRALARRVVPAALADGRRSGGLGQSDVPEELTLSGQSEVEPPPTPSRPPRPAQTWTIAAGALAAGATLGLLLLIGGGAWWLSRATTPTATSDGPATPSVPSTAASTSTPNTPTSAPPRAASDPASSPRASEVKSAASTTGQATTPSATKSSTPRAGKAQASAGASNGKSAPVPPEPTSTQTPATTRKVTIASLPFGLSVSIDGTTRGKTPLVVDLTEGEHQIAVESPGGQSTSRSIDVGEDHPNKYSWDMAKDAWSASMSR